MQHPLIEYLKSHAQPMTFHDYMKAVLYAPGIGYYSNGESKIGAQGDFITASALTPIFAKCLARQFSQVLSELRNGQILELGAGTGQFALDILCELDQLNQLPQKYLILDVSEGLKADQRQLFETSGKQFLNIVEWIDRLPEEPINGIIFGNEVLDAMPVHRFIKSGGNVVEQGVTVTDDGLKYCELEASQNLIEHVTEIEAEQGQFADGYYSEVNLAVKPWLASLNACLKKGAMLFIDYGYAAREYYHSERSAGTVQCYHKHQANGDPLINIGEQDITAHVDFTHVASSGIDLDLELLGYTTQMYFLLGCGLNVSEELDVKTSQQLRRLLMPGGMGEMFKVIGFGRDLDSELIGFSLRDRRVEL